MNQNAHDILKKINAHLAVHPNASLQATAEKLGMTPQEVERILTETEGISFQQLRESSRLEEAFRLLKANETAAIGSWEVQRAGPRIIVPGTTLKYHIHRGWIHKPRYSNSCPTIDLCGGGLAFLDDLLQKPGMRISMLLKLQGREEEIPLEGSVVYSVATGIAGYRYRVGIQFLPFTDREGCNSLETLAILIKFEKDHLNS